MYARYEEVEEENVTGRCLVSKSGDTAPMTSKVRSLLQSFNIPSSTYDYVLTEFDTSVAYMNNLVISASNLAKKASTQLLETQRILETKKYKIESLELQITNIMVDMDNLNTDNKILLKQRNIYCNTTKRLYGKLT